MSRQWYNGSERAEVALYFGFQEQEKGMFGMHFPKFASFKVETRLALTNAYLRPILHVRSICGTNGRRVMIMDGQFELSFWQIVRILWR